MCALLAFSFGFWFWNWFYECYGCKVAFFSVRSYWVFGFCLYNVGVNYAVQCLTKKNIFFVLDSTI